MGVEIMFVFYISNSGGGKQIVLEKSRRLQSPSVGQPFNGNVCNPLASIKIARTSYSKLRGYDFTAHDSSICNRKFCPSKK